MDLVKRMELVENELGFFPEPSIMAEMLKVPVERVTEVLRFATELVYIDELDSFEPEDRALSYENGVMDKVYVESLLECSGLDDFETSVAVLIMEGYNNSRIAEQLEVYPMTINRTIDRIRSKMENDFSDKRTSKYEEEIGIVSEEMEELGCFMNIDVIKDLLDVCGIDVSSLTPRILYYIRQKAAKRVPGELVECAD